MSDSEFERYTSNKRISWNNYEQDIGEGRNYKGEWTTKDGKRIPEGFCIMILSDGSQYFGQFKDNTFNGRGVLKQQDGCVYWGDW